MLVIWSVITVYPNSQWQFRVTSLKARQDIKSAKGTFNSIRESEPMENNVIFSILTVP